VAVSIEETRKRKGAGLGRRFFVDLGGFSLRKIATHLKSS
jgi:hypothetical protein